MYKSILFTHDDMDGAGCRIIYTLAHQHQKFGEEYFFLNCSNNSVDDDVINMMSSGNIDPKITHVIFGDISASVPVLQKLSDAGYNVDIFDHHRTNFGAQQVFPNAQIIPENALGVMQSGTSIMYQHYSQIAEDHPSDPRGTYFSKKGNQKILSIFVDTVRSYDTYEWKTTNNILAKQLQTLFFLLGMERFCNRYIEAITNSSGEDLITQADMDFVLAKIESEQKTIDNFTPDDVFQIDVRGYNCALVLTTKGASISELAYQFLTKYPEFDMMIGFSLVNNGKFEMRTVRDDIDLGGIIAAPIGGGGHPKAAGAPLPLDTSNMLIDMIIDVLNS